MLMLGGDRTLCSVHRPLNTQDDLIKCQVESVISIMGCCSPCGRSRLMVCVLVSVENVIPCQLLLLKTIKRNIGSEVSIFKNWS